MVTTANAFTPAAPAKTTAAAPAKAAASARSPAPARKPARKAVAKKLTNKPAPIAKPAAKKVVKALAAKPVKASVPAAAAPAVKALAKPVLAKVVKAKAAKPVKERKPKLVRDSFTMPKVEYGVLAELKQRAGKLGSPVKKSELLRAGTKALAAMADNAFLAALKAVPAIKTGRPSKD